MLAILGLVLVGGVMIALLLTRVKAKLPAVPTPDAFRNVASTDVINMAHIKVAGSAGLALVVVAFTVGLDIPEIGQLQAAGLAFGMVFAAGLILWRRRRGPISSSGSQMGANTMLSIDAPPPGRETHRPGSTA